MKSVGKAGESGSRWYVTSGVRVPVFVRCVSSIAAVRLLHAAPSTLSPTASCLIIRRIGVVSRT